MIPRQARNNDTITTRKHRPDYGLFILASILLAIGLIVMYAISPALAAQGGNVGEYYFVIRQFIAVVIGVAVFFIVAKIPLTVWEKWQKPLIGITLVVSLLTLFTGLGGLGNRWIEFGALSFQPVELIKLMVVVTFASFLAKAIDNKELLEYKTWKVPMIIAAIVAFIVVILQKDLGSAVVLFSIILAMLYMAGFPFFKLFIAGLVILMLAGLAVASTPYRRDRVATFLNPTQDCSDEGYHSCQALIAVGSGGVMGVGLGRSIQAYGYLPESQNDSIFAIYAEKFGFIGSVALIAALGALLLRILNIMQRAPNRTAMLICAGVFTWFTVQGTINIGAMVGILPLKGITLPFVSYGGSSLIFSMAALGLVFHISKYTSSRRILFDLPMKGEGNESTSHWRRDSRPRYTVTRRSL